MPTPCTFSVVRFAFAILVGVASPGLGVVNAGPLTEGTVLPNYAVVSVGPSSSIMVNSGPINGAVLLGDGGTSSSSGGGGGLITGGVFVSGTEGGDHLSHIATLPTITTIPATVGTQAFSDAASLSSNAAALTPNQTFGGTFSGSLTVTGHGGLTVIDFQSLQNPTLKIQGSAADTFVFNVSGLFNTNIPMTLIGVTASQILWNFTGTSGTVFQTSGGDVLDGTFLATDGGDFQFSNLDLTGQLIDTAGHIQFVSGSSLPTFSPFSPPVPEPSTIAVFGAALAGLGLVRRRRRDGSSPS